METPYINTKLYTNVTAHPNQLNNNLYLNIKKNLIRDLEKRCYREYGYIQNIFSITRYDEGRLQAENTTASVKYNIEFTCRICRPINGMVISAKINNLNKAIIKLENGPISIIVTNERINENVFFRDNNTGTLKYKKDGHSSPLEQNDFVRVKIVQHTFNHGDSLIVAIGYIENICSDAEIEKYYNELHIGHDEEGENNDDGVVVKEGEKSEPESDEEKPVEKPATKSKKTSRASKK